MSEDDVSAGRIHDVGVRAQFHIETGVRRGILLRHKDDLVCLQHAKLAALASLMCQTTHDRQGVHDQPLCWGMLLHQLEESQRQRIPLFTQRGNIPPTFQTDEHAKDL